MNEQLVAMWNRLRRRIDYVVIFTLAVLLGVVVLLYWVEQQAPQPKRPTLPPTPVSPTPADWPSFMNQVFLQPKQLSKVTSFAGLLDYNMFDARSIAVQSELVAQMDREFTKAQDAYLKNDLDTAERICTEIIRRMPSHRKTIELLKMIRERRKAEANQTKQNP